MSISEGRQCAQRPNPFQHQPPDIPSPSLAPTRATAILPKCSGKSRKSLSGQSDAANHGKLVYAVHNVTDSEQSVSDEMLLKSVAEGDKAASTFCSLVTAQECFASSNERSAIQELQRIWSAKFSSMFGVLQTGSKAGREFPHGYSRSPALKQ